MVSKDELEQYLMNEIYTAYGSHGRDITAGDLAEGLAHRMIHKFGITNLDPAPWCYYDGEKIISRRASWAEDFDAFLPREGFEQRLALYPGMASNEKLCLDDEPWYLPITQERLRILVSGDPRSARARFQPRPGYEQNMNVYIDKRKLVR